MKIKTLKDELINAKINVENDFETAEDCETYFLTLVETDSSKLPMNVYLRCRENCGEQPFLRFQNDKEKVCNSNWIKIYVDCHIDNYENKKLIFNDDEMRRLKNWINFNKDIIIKHYHQEITSAEVYQLLEEKLKEEWEKAGFTRADIEEMDRRHAMIGIEPSYTCEEVMQEMMKIFKDKE